MNDAGRPFYDPKTTPPPPPGMGLPGWGDEPPAAEVGVSEPEWVLRMLPGDQFDVPLYVRPAWWRRVLQRVLLGWRYERAARRDFSWVPRENEFGPPDCPAAPGSGPRPTAPGSAPGPPRGPNRP